MNRPAVAVHREEHVVVIGGGVIGCWAAYHLARRGRRVLLVERDQIGSGASGGNCGYICPSHVLPLCGPGVIRSSIPQILSRRGALSIPARLDPKLWHWLYAFSRHCNANHQQHAALARNVLLRRSDRLYREFLQDRDACCSWKQRGLLTVHRHEKSLDAFVKTAERLSSDFGIHLQRVEGERLRELEPSLMESIAGAWHFQGDSHLDPAALMRELHTELRKLGIEVWSETEVHCLHVQNRRINSIETSRGRLRADQFVLATGAEAPRFARDLRCQIPIVPGKGYSMTFAAASQSDATQREGSPSTWPRIPMIFEDTHVAVTPMEGRLRVGSTMQLTGYDRRIDPARLKMIRESAQSYLRHRLVGEPEQTWVGWRPMVPDGLPCIGRCPAVDNAFIAAGNGMVGIATGTGTGCLVAELVCGEVASIDPEPYALSRFGRFKNQRITSSSTVPARPVSQTR
ncbi:MAG: FAD-dependent oxidoreductase [Planctomycetota bacterium]